MRQLTSSQVWCRSRRLTPDRIVYDLVSAGEPQLSPDGKFVAYSSDESGRGEVYVQPVPDRIVVHG